VIGMAYRTRTQVFAERAFRVVSDRSEAGGKEWEDYGRFAKSFPALVQSRGLAQACAFAEAKKMRAILSDLETVLEKSRDTLVKESRESSLEQYMLLSREVMAAAGWIKRYVQALSKEDDAE